MIQACDEEGKPMCESCGARSVGAVQVVRYACDYFDTSIVVAWLCAEHARYGAFKPEFHKRIDDESSRLRAAETPDWMLT